MSLSIQRSEQFLFNNLNIRSYYLKEHGQCLLARDIYKAVGYTRDAGKQAIQRLVPDEYKLRFGDVPQGGIIFDTTQPNTILLTEPGVYRQCQTM